MPESRHDPFSRRERQIMDVIYSLRDATATQVLERLSDPPSRTAVRTLLRILEDKGFLKHKKKGREFIYQPTQPRARAGRSALHRVLGTFFDGSLEKALSAHLSDPKAKMDPDELKRLAALVRKARKEQEEE